MVEQAPHKSFACHLAGESLVHLRGAAIAEFLQGQLTCDTRGLGAGRMVRGALCNAQGRVLADLLALALKDNHVVLRMRGSIASDCAATLAKYARFSRIECQPDTGDWGLVGLCGPPDPQWAALLGLQPSADSVVAGADGLHCYPAAEGMLEVLAPAARITALREALAADSAPGEQAWRAEELRRGIYRIEPDDVGKFTPQALNYDLAGFVSFTKGCYTGQEVVARLHYRGQAKRRLAVFAANLAQGPARGSPLTDPRGETVGTVLRAESGRDGSQLIAGELRVAALGQCELHCHGAPVRAVSLPYELPAAVTTD